MYQLDANNFTMILFSQMASTCFGHLHVHLQEFLYIGCFTAACGAQDYTPTPQDHSLNTYGITPHAAVKQPIYKNS